MLHRYFPNILTVFRILMSPVFFMLIIQNQPYFKMLSFLLLLFVSLTDFFDGFYARYYNLTTSLGRYLDPFADKIFVSTVLFSFYYIMEVFVPLWMLFAIIFRDIIVTIFRIYCKYKNIDFTTSVLGKRKTLFQIICLHLILLILILEQYFNYKVELGFIYYIMFFCTILTIISGLDYFYRYFKNK